MATDEHKKLANVIKDCHKSLRELQKKHGFEVAWKLHLGNKHQLDKYTDAMRKLSDIWENNSEHNINNCKSQLAFSRIKWAVNYCLKYYDDEIFLIKRCREFRQLISLDPDNSRHKSYTINNITYENELFVLDVGSCHNPFVHVRRFCVTAIDLNPASPDVLSGDFLQIDVEQFGAACSSAITMEEGVVRKIQSGYFHCVMFSLLLEYIPSSEQRLKCCRKAYDALKTEGILLIITPDSGHVGKNSQLMKQWRYALASIGFMRVCFDKLPHITCMAFRKSLIKELPQIWLERQNLKYPLAEIDIKIPQDSI